MAAWEGDGDFRAAVSADPEVTALLTGDERQAALERAKTDFEGCVASFGQIVEFGNAARHVETCKTQLRQITLQLNPEGEF